MSNASYTALTLNGHRFTADELRSVVREKHAASLSRWEKELYDFMAYWIDDAQTSLEVTTSGSTGKPKKIRITKEQMINSAKMTLKHFSLM